MTIYTNLEVMLRDIIAYMRMMPQAHVLLAGDTSADLLGYCVDPAEDPAEDPVGVRWEIPMEIVRGQAPREVLRTWEGRTKLVDLMREESTRHTTTLENVVQWRSHGRSIGAAEDSRFLASLGRIAATGPVDPEDVWDRLMKG